MYVLVLVLRMVRMVWIGENVGRILYWYALVLEGNLRAGDDRDTERVDRNLNGSEYYENQVNLHGE